jgi:hypothetical protein
MSNNQDKQESGQGRNGAVTRSKSPSLLPRSKSPSALSSVGAANKKPQGEKIAPAGRKSPSISASTVTSTVSSGKLTLLPTTELRSVTSVHPITDDDTGLAIGSDEEQDATVSELVLQTFKDAVKVSEEAHGGKDQSSSSIEDSAHGVEELTQAQTLGLEELTQAQVHENSSHSAGSNSSTLYKVGGGQSNEGGNQVTATSKALNQVTATSKASNTSSNDPTVTDSSNGDFNEDFLDPDVFDLDGPEVTEEVYETGTTAATFTANSSFDESRNSNERQVTNIGGAIVVNKAEDRDMSGLINMGGGETLIQGDGYGTESNHEAETFTGSAHIIGEGRDVTLEELNGVDYNGTGEYDYVSNPSTTTTSRAQSSVGYDGCQAMDISNSGSLSTSRTETPMDEGTIQLLRDLTTPPVGNDSHLLTQKGGTSRSRSRSKSRSGTLVSLLTFVQMLMTSFQSL